jgi:acyl-CoA thioesterase-1
LIRTDPIETHTAHSRLDGWRAEHRRFLAAPWRPALVAVTTLAALAGVVAAAPWRKPCDDVFCVIAFGDSITAGTGLPTREGFASMLEARLRADGYAARVINAGVRGDTSAQGFARLGPALKDGADLAIVEFGANDLFKRIDPEIVRDNLDKIVAAFKARNTRVLLAGLRKSDAPASEHMPAFDAIYPDIARKYSIALHPYFLRRIVANGHGIIPSLVQEDGSHPNAQGVVNIVEDLAPFVERELDTIAASRLAAGQISANNAIASSTKE